LTKRNFTTGNCRTGNSSLAL